MLMLPQQCLLSSAMHIKCGRYVPYYAFTLCIFQLFEYHRLLHIAYPHTVSLPILIRQPRSTLVEVHKTAVFECTARSYGFVSITWRRMNLELPLTANVTTTKSLNDVTSILSIEKSVGYYKGYYYCVVENKAGRVNSKPAYFNITGTPLYI